MKTFLTLFTLMFLVSCGDKVTKTRFIENKFDDTAIKNQLAAHEARIQALEIAQQGFLVEDDIKDFLTSSELAEQLEIIDSLASKSELMTIVPICGTREMMLKSGNEFFAVISTITKVGQGVNQHDNISNVHLGKLTDGGYRLTDGSNVTFSVMNGAVSNCSNTN